LHQHKGAEAGSCVGTGKELPEVPALDAVAQSYSMIQKEIQRLIFNENSTTSMTSEQHKTKQLVLMSC
jgi:hypothetical protein